MEAQKNVERLMSLLHARKTAEAAHAEDPLDADNLFKWGIALQELAEFQSFAGSQMMLLDAISKLEEVLDLNPKKHEAFWHLGNAHTTYGFLTFVQEEAYKHFEEATACFQLAVDKDPGNAWYRNCLKRSLEAPELYAMRCALEKEFKEPGPEIYALNAGMEAMGSDPKSYAPSADRELYVLSGGLEGAAPELFAPSAGLEFFVRSGGLEQQAMGAALAPASAAGAKSSKKKKSSDLSYDICGWVILAVGIVGWIGFVKSHMPPPPTQ